MWIIAHPKLWNILNHIENWVISPILVVKIKWMPCRVRKEVWLEPLQRLELEQKILTTKNK